MVIIDGIEIKWLICIATNHAHLISIPSNSSTNIFDVEQITKQELHLENLLFGSTFMESFCPFIQNRENRINSMRSLS